MGDCLLQLCAAGEPSEPVWAAAAAAALALCSPSQGEGLLVEAARAALPLPALRRLVEASHHPRQCAPWRASLWARPSPQMTRPSTQTRSPSNQLQEARRRRPRCPLATAEVIAVAAEAEAIGVAAEVEALPPPPPPSGSATGKES